MRGKEEEVESHDEAGAAWWRGRGRLRGTVKVRVRVRVRVRGRVRVGDQG